MTTSVNSPTVQMFFCCKITLFELAEGFFSCCLIRMFYFGLALSLLDSSLLMASVMRSLDLNGWLSSSWRWPVDERRCSSHSPLDAGEAASVRVWDRERRKALTWVLFSSPRKPKSFQDSPSHRILWHMHETLNIDENKN